MLRRALPRNPMSDPARMIAFECVYPKQMWPHDGDVQRGDHQFPGTSRCYVFVCVQVRWSRCICLFLDNPLCCGGTCDNSGGGWTLIAISYWYGNISALKSRNSVAKTDQMFIDSYPRNGCLYLGANIRSERDLIDVQEPDVGRAMTPQQCTCAHLNTRCPRPLTHALNGHITHCKQKIAFSTAYG